MKRFLSPLVLVVGLCCYESGQVFAQSSAKPPPAIPVVLFDNPAAYGDDLPKIVVDTRDALRDDKRLEVLLFNPDLPTFTLAAYTAALSVPLANVSTPADESNVTIAVGAKYYVVLAPDSRGKKVNAQVFEAATGVEQSIGKAEDIKDAASDIAQLIENWSPPAPSNGLPDTNTARPTNIPVAITPAARPDGQAQQSTAVTTTAAPPTAASAVAPALTPQVASVMVTPLVPATPDSTIVVPPISAGAVAPHNPNVSPPSPSSTQPLPLAAALHIAPASSSSQSPMPSSNLTISPSSAADLPDSSAVLSPPIDSTLTQTAQTVGPAHSVPTAPIPTKNDHPSAPTPPVIAQSKLPPSEAALGQPTIVTTSVTPPTVAEPTASAPDVSGPAAPAVAQATVVSTPAVSAVPATPESPSVQIPVAPVVEQATVPSTSPAPLSSVSGVLPPAGVSSPSNESQVSGGAPIITITGVTSSSIAAYPTATPYQSPSTAVDQTPGSSSPGESSDSAASLPQPGGQMSADAKSLDDQGDASMQTADDLTAIMLYKKSISLAPRAAEPRMKLAQAYLAAGMKENALEEAKRALAIDPGNTEVQNFIESQDAGVAGSNGDVIVAQAQTESDPNNPSAWISLGDAYWNVGDPDDSLISYKHAEDINPNAIDPQTRLVKLYAARGQYDESLAALQRAGDAGYPYALKIISSTTETLLGDLDDETDLFNKGEDTREVFYGKIKATDSQAENLADFVGKIQPPDAYKLSHLHRELSTRLLAQTADVWIDYAETNEDSDKDQAAALEQHSITEMKTASVAEDISSRINSAP